MSIASMTRLLVLCGRPLHLTAEETDRWLREQLGELHADEGVAGIHFTSVDSASMAWGRPCDYLIEIALRAGADPNAIVRASECAAFLGDLRLLGMRPAVLVADDQRTVTVLEEPA